MYYSFHTGSLQPIAIKIFSLQYCFYLITVFTTRVKNDRDVMCLPACDVTVIILATFRMFYEHFHSNLLLHSAYLSQIL